MKVAIRVTEYYPVYEITFIDWQTEWVLDLPEDLVEEIKSSERVFKAMQKKINTAITFEEEVQGR